MTKSIAIIIAVFLAMPAFAQSVRELREQVAGELAAYCKRGSPISVGSDALSFGSDGVATVRLAEFSCDWEFTNHPFCGARYCTVRDYEYRGGRFVVVGERLQ
jgi:hypothetical protein